MKKIIKLKGIHHLIGTACTTINRFLCPDSVRMKIVHFLMELTNKDKQLTLQEVTGFNGEVWVVLGKRPCSLLL
jgi:hypothetical protein